MAINKNHEFEELNGVKCAIVEKNCSSERVSFLKELLEWNKYEVVVVESPAAKAAPAPAKADPAAANADPVEVKAAPAKPDPAAPNAVLSSSASVPAISVTDAKATNVAESIITSTASTPLSNAELNAVLETPKETPPPPPPTYTVGVTDLTFNAINAIFGRILKTKDNRIVTQAYWKQQVTFSNDEVPYFEMKKV